MKRTTILVLVALAACVVAPGCESLGGIGPVEGGSQVISNLGQSALNALIAYAESHGWTKAQVAQATNDAPEALRVARGARSSAAVSAEAAEWARAYVAAGN